MESVTCLACGGDGSLLLCSEEGCEFAVHDKCLPCSPYFHDSGSFYCPQCSYDLSVDECIRAKKHATLAKQDLLKFISAAGCKDKLSEFEGCKEKQPLPGSLEKDVCQAGGVGENENSDICKGAADSTNKCLESEILANPRLVENCHVTETRDVIGFPGISIETEQKESADELSVESNGKDELFVEESDISDSEFGSPISPKHKVKRVQKEKIRDKYARRCSNNLDLQNADADVSVKQGQDIDFATSSRRRKFNHSNDRSNSATPTKLRPRKHWSDAEVEILKEGVQKFAVPHAKMPWSRILEYGSHVFEHHRTAVDLKDKWRNLTW